MTPNIQFNRGAIDAGQAVSQGWEMIKSNYWTFFLMTLIFIGGRILLGCIPFVGGLGFQIFLAPALTVGIFYAFFRQMIGQRADVGMMFQGFNKYGVVLVVGLIQAIPTIAATILSWIFNISSNLIQILGPKLGRGGGYRSDLAMQSDAAPLIAGGLLVVVLIVAVVAIIFSILWGITFFFAFPLIADREVSAMDAIKLSASAGWSNVGGLLLLFIIEFFMALAGVLALCIGIFFVVPIIFAANAIAYRMVFPQIADQFNYNPPPPSTYRDFGPGGMAA